MTKLLLPMAEMPGCIRESLRSVLRPHGITLPEPILHEAGNNITQGLFAVDEGERVASLREWADARLAQPVLDSTERALLQVVLKILDGVLPREALFDDGDDIDDIVDGGRDSDAPRQP